MPTFDERLQEILRLGYMEGEYGDCPGDDNPDIADLRDAWECRERAEVELAESALDSGQYLASYGAVHALRRVLGTEEPAGSEEEGS